MIMVSNPTIQYMLYEWGAQWWRRPSKGKASAGANLSSFEVFLISAMAKLGATLSTYPLLVVKNRVQVCYSCSHCRPACMTAFIFQRCTQPEKHTSGHPLRLMKEELRLQSNGFEFRGPEWGPYRTGMRVQQELRRDGSATALSSVSLSLKLLCCDG